MRKKQYGNLYTMKTLAFFLIALSVLLFILTVSFQVPRLQIWYNQYQDYLLKLEIRVARLRNKISVITAVFLLFVLKAYLPIPIVSLSCICIISTIVFGAPVSLIINILGLVIIFTIRYYIGVGKKNLPYKILKNYEEIWNVLKYGNKGNAWLLFICRLIPAFPVNAVSDIYGSLEYDFRKYLLISVLGFLPKIVSYSVIGHNVFNPFSVSFLIPLMLSCFFSGIGLATTRKIILFIRRKGEEDVKIKN